MKKKLLILRKRAAIRRRRGIRQFRIFSKHPFAVPVFTFLALGILMIVGAYLWTQRGAEDISPRVVIVSHDNVQEAIPSRQATVGDLLNKMELKINDGDVVEPALATTIDQDQFRINVYRAKPVDVIENGKDNFTYSAATTSRSIASQAGLSTFAEDSLVTVPVDNFVTERAVGQKVIVTRATPVNVNVYGVQTLMRTQAKTVGDLLDEKHIVLANDDQVVPTADQPIAANSQIYIIHNGTAIATETETLPMPVQTIEDKNLAYGTQAIRQVGSEGKKVVTYKVNLENDKEVSRQIIQTIVASEPVTQIVAVGINLSGIKGDMAAAGISSSDYTFVDYIITKESHWNPLAVNDSSGAYGLCQALPGGKMASVASDWRTNPITQLKWCSGYAKERYGGWAGAYRFWINNYWW